MRCTSCAIATWGVIKSMTWSLTSLKGKMNRRRNLTKMPWMRIKLLDCSINYIINPTLCHESRLCIRPLPLQQDHCRTVEYVAKEGMVLWYSAWKKKK
mmetsp:Transcript_42950/g.52107  ORF Transcript_42950/g.52107 Transcript_42950/m.52107 type:complete len:98 (+) Transcript_42950:1886-2179(+)